MEVPEVPILIGNLIIPIVALLGALMLAWGMLADVLDLCRIVGEISYDVGNLYEVAHSLPGDVIVRYSGPSECKIESGVINCSFFTVDMIGKTSNVKSTYIYTTPTWFSLSNFFTSFARVTVSDDYVGSTGFKSRTFYVYRGIDEPVPSSRKELFSIGDAVVIKKEEREDPLSLIYNTALELKNTCEKLPCETKVFFVIGPDEILKNESDDLCLYRKVKLTFGDLSTINETTNTLYIYDGEEIMEVDLTEFQNVSCKPHYEDRSYTICTFEFKDSSEDYNVHAAWYFKKEDCLNFSELIDDIKFDSCEVNGTKEVDGHEVPAYVQGYADITYDGTLKITCDET